MQIKAWWPVLFVATIILTCALIFPSDLRLADLLRKSGKVDQAIQKYRDLIEEHPTRDDLRIDLSRLYITKGDFEKAVAQVEQVGLTYFSDLVTLHELADIYSQLENKERTVAVHERIVALTPDDLLARRGLAEAYQWNGQNQKARAIYADLFAHNPGDMVLADKLVSLSLMDRDFKHALQYARQRVDIDPKNIDNRILLGNLYLQNDRRQFAAVEFEQVLNAKPDDDRLRQRLAEIYVWLQNYPRAVGHYEYLVSHNVLKGEYFERLVELCRDYYPETATRYFKYRLRYLPNDNRLREELYDHYLHLGMTEEAIQQMNALVERNPQEPSYLSDLGYLYRDTLEPELATETFAHLVDKGFFTRDIFNELKLSYSEDKSYDKLLDLYDRVKATDLYDLRTETEHAYLQAMTQHYEPAINSYEDVIRQKPDDVRSRLELAELYRLTGRTPAAVTLLMEGFEKYHQDDEEFLVYTARVFEDERQYDESIDVYQQLADLSPANESYRRALLPLYIRKHDYKQAASLYETLLRSNPKDRGLKFEYASLYWLQNEPDHVHELVAEIRKDYASQPDIDKQIGLFYFERGFFSEAATNFDAALRTAPQDSVSMRSLGLAYAWNNQPARAKEALFSYHALYPGDYYTHYHLGILLDAEQKSQQARDEFRTAEKLAQGAEESRQTRLVLANIAAYNDEPSRSNDLYKRLIADFPGDISVLADYAESLIILKDYSRADVILQQAINKEPGNYRALRLQARSFFEQKRYTETIALLKLLRQKNGMDLGINVDLADAQWLAGDWYNSQKILRQVLDAYPKYEPAEQRLIAMRRGQAEAVAVDYNYDEQSDNLVRQVTNVVWNKAASSLFSFNFLFGKETFSTQDNTLPANDYSNVEFGIRSSYNESFQTGFAGKARRRDNRWRVAGHGEATWKFGAENSFLLSADVNELWRDPFSAAFFDGSLDRVQTDLNLALWKNIVVWNRISLEKHQINAGVPFGQATYLYGQVGYRWGARPQLQTYYQLYKLSYDYDNTANRNIISIPTTQTIHYLGAVIDHQLSRRFFYQVGANVGLNATQNSAQYYATAQLEYTLLRNFRLRSRFAFGKQNTLAGNENNKTLSLDFYYFY